MSNCVRTYNIVNVLQTIQIDGQQCIHFVYTIDVFSLNILFKKHLINEINILKMKHLLRLYTTICTYNVYCIYRINNSVFFPRLAFVCIYTHLYTWCLCLLYGKSNKLRTWHFYESTMLVNFIWCK